MFCPCSFEPEKFRFLAQAGLLMRMRFSGCFSGHWDAGPFKQDAEAGNSVFVPASDGVSRGGANRQDELAAIGTRVNGLYFCPRQRAECHPCVMLMSRAKVVGAPSMPFHSA
jgi:hypothetical protein